MRVEVMAYTIIGAINVAIESCVLAFVANRLLVKRFHPGLIYVIFICAQIIRSMMRGSGEVWFGLVLGVASHVLALIICYRREIKKKISLFIIYSAITVCCEIAITFVLALFLLGWNFDELLILYVAYALHKMILGGLVFIFLKLRKTSFYIKEWLKYLFIPLAIVLSMLWFYDTSKENSEAMAHMLGLGILGFLTCIFLIGFVQYKEMQKRTAERLRMTEEHKWDKRHYIEDREVLLRRQRLLAHDSHHHIEYVASLSTIEDVREYTAKILQLNALDIQITGNHDIDCILWPKQQRAEEKKIGFNVTGWLPEQMAFLDRVDIVTIIGNGLANAIDACEKVLAPDRAINMIFRFDKHLDIRIDNPYVEVPVPQKTGWFKSTKKDPGHGIGMESIQEAVNKYDGYMETVVEDGIFSLRIMLQQVNPPKVKTDGSANQKEPTAHISSA